MANLLELFEQLPDPRQRSGRRHQLSLVLVLVVMATMTGYHEYRGSGDVIVRNADD